MRGRARTTFIVSFLAPSVALFGLFVCVPVVQAFHFSLYRWSGLSSVKTFVGLENFRALFKDSVFRQTVVHNLTFLVVGGGLILLLALLIAHCLQGKGKAVSFLRGTFLLPQIISLVVVAVLWMFVYYPDAGLLDGLLKLLHLQRLSRAWLGESSTALWAMVAVFVWQGLGFYVMLLSAGLRGIPEEVLEAATLDGASGLRRFRKVTLPMLWSIMRVAVVYVAINSLNVFALVYLMTQGGPDRKTEVMLTYLYEQGFKNNEFGFATAIAVANFAIVMGVSLLILAAFRKDPQEARAAR